MDVGGFRKAEDMSSDEPAERARPSKEQVLDRVSIILGEALLKVLESDPREAAERAWISGGPSVDELEVEIREFQAEYRVAE